MGICFAKGVSIFGEEINNVFYYKKGDGKNK
jgi:hypothetical protein